MSGHGGARGIKEKVARKVFAETVMRCSLCEDSGWVCEIHRHNGDHTCACAGSGMPPCPWCNTYADTSHAKGLSPRSTNRWSTIDDRRGEFTEIEYSANFPARG